MKEKLIQEPQQQRSIDKKNRILDAGFELICNMGYYHTNTAEIAKKAGVSSGIVYRYFEDKKDIFLQAIQKRFTPIVLHISQTLQNIQTQQELEELFPSLIQQLVNSHDSNIEAFRETSAIMLLDKDVCVRMKQIEETLCHEIEATLLRLKYDNKNMKERVYLIYHFTDLFCDNSIQLRKQSELSFDVIFQQHLSIIMKLLRNE